MSQMLPGYLFIAFWVVFVANCARDEYEGNSCRNSDGTIGVCRLLVDCKIALEAVIKSKSHSYHRCGFSNDIEIVCCPKAVLKQPEVVKTPSTKPRVTLRPSTEKSVSRTNARKCEQVCDKFTNSMGPDIAFHIMNGEETKLGEFPHMAAVGYKNDEGEYLWRCGATLISERWLVTASHCRYPPDGLEPTRIKLGLVELNKTTIESQEFTIEQFILNPNYSYKNKWNDIALIQVDREVTFNKNVWPACLYTQNDDPLGLIVTGWGQTSNAGPTSNKLLKARLNAVSVPECNRTYMELIQKNITETQICANNNLTNSDACGGDSGGPLQVQIKKKSDIFSLVGITSYGNGCGGSAPGVYTRVSKYIDWIEELVWP